MAGKRVYCASPDPKGRQIMSAIAQFLGAEIVGPAVTLNAAGQAEHETWRGSND